MSFSADQLADNIMMAVDGLVAHDARQVGHNFRRYAKRLCCYAAVVRSCTSTRCSCYSQSANSYRTTKRTQGKNIQAIHVKSDSSVALPVYNSMPTADDIT